MRFQELSDLCFKSDLVTANMKYHVRLFSKKLCIACILAVPLASLLRTLRTTRRHRNEWRERHQIKGLHTEQNNGCVRLTYIILGTLASLPSLANQRCELTNFQDFFFTVVPTTTKFLYFYLVLNVFVAYATGPSFYTDKHTG